MSEVIKNRYEFLVLFDVEDVYKRQVKCKGCGGINKIQRGAVGECEYCGSPISGE